MPRSSLEKNSRGIIQPIAGRNKKVHTFPEGICMTVNVSARLEMELAYYDAKV